MNYLYSYTPAGNTPQENSAYVGELTNGDYVHLLPNEDPAATLIGHWDNDGSLTVVDMLAYDQLRPLGNDAGVATGALDLIHYAGHAQRHLQAAPAVDTMPEYPSGTQPFTATMARRMDETPGWEGHGWSFTVEFVDPNRPPTNRAVGIYSDPECTAYLYTAGALVLTDTGEVEVVDEVEIPIMKYMSVNPAGKATVAPEDIYFALLHGSAQEGINTLLAGDEENMRYYWENDQ